MPPAQAEFKKKKKKKRQERERERESGLKVWEGWVQKPSKEVNKLILQFLFWKMVQSCYSILSLRGISVWKMFTFKSLLSLPESFPGKWTTTLQMPLGIFNDLREWYFVTIRNILLVKRKYIVKILNVVLKDFKRISTRWHLAMLPQLNKTGERWNFRVWVLSLLSVLLSIFILCFSNFFLSLS